MKNECGIIEDICYEVKINAAIRRANERCKHVKIKRANQVSDFALMNIIKDCDFKPMRNEFLKLSVVGVTIGLAITCLLRAFNYCLNGVNLI